MIGTIYDCCGHGCEFLDVVEQLFASKEKLSSVELDVFKI
jgi:hypothetical protein